MTNTPESHLLLAHNALPFVESAFTGLQNGLELTTTDVALDKLFPHLLQQTRQPLGKHIAAAGKHLGIVLQRLAESVSAGHTPLIMRPGLSRASGPIPKQGKPQRMPPHILRAEGRLLDQPFRLTASVINAANRQRLESAALVLPQQNDRSVVLAYTTTIATRGQVQRDSETLVVTGTVPEKLDAPIPLTADAWSGSPAGITPVLRGRGNHQQLKSASWRLLRRETALPSLWPSDGLGRQLNWAENNAADETRQLGELVLRLSGISSGLMPS